MQCLSLLNTIYSGAHLRDYMGARPIGAGEGVAGGLQLPLLSRNLLDSGNFPERTMGNLGSFSDFALIIRVELLQPP